MKFIHTVVLSTCLCAVAAPAAFALPTANASGNYQLSQLRGKPGQTNWTVVDADPKGLNCRMAKQYRSFSMDAADTPANLYINNVHRIYNWSIVGTFRKNDRLQAVTGNMGRNQIVLFDDRGMAWIPVVAPKNAQARNCFVRANDRLIKPLKEDQSGKVLE